MATYLLTWNPERSKWSDLADAVAETKTGNMPHFQWSTGNRRSMETGDRIFLFRQVIDRGIIASGYAVSPPVRGPHWDETRTDEANYVEVRWDTVFDPTDVLPVADLEAAELGVTWSALLGSGVQVPERFVRRLEEIWNSHIRKTRQLRFSYDLGGKEIAPVQTDELLPSQFFEGAFRVISVNAYERNPNARQACVDHFGFQCAVCRFNFADFYGDIGEGFIHVHHLRNLASVGEEYEVDPIQDLRPVCPNCHAMLHRSTPALTIGALQEMIRRIEP